MKRVLIVSPLNRDFAELPTICRRLDVEPVFHDFRGFSIIKNLLAGGDVSEGFDFQRLVERIVRDCVARNIDAVTTVEEYPGSIVASVVARKLGMVAPSPASVLLCQHKYETRRVLQKHVTSATPWFCLLRTRSQRRIFHDLPYPLFIKPVKSIFSIGAYRVTSAREMARLLAKPLVPAAYVRPFCKALHMYSAYTMHPGDLLVEELLKGKLVTLEGYVYRKTVYIIGIVDLIMFSNKLSSVCKLSCARFDYPSHLFERVQRRMHVLAKQIIGAVGLDNVVFNVEFMYNEETDEIHCIEINPRMASQFADLHEKVDGINTYEISISLALGKKPETGGRVGKYAVASCFILRTLKDTLVVGVPSTRDVDDVRTLFPDSRIIIQVSPGKRLSDYMQDGYTFKYGMIHLGGGDEEELHEKFKICQRMLPFRFVYM